MEIYLHRKFQKAFRKQPKKVQESFFKALDVFVHDPFYYTLYNHALTGEFSGTRSFNVTGDIRVHFKNVKDGIMLMNIGTHRQLY